MNKTTSFAPLQPTGNHSRDCLALWVMVGPGISSSVMSEISPFSFSGPLYHLVAFGDRTRTSTSLMSYLEMSTTFQKTADRHFLRPWRCFPADSFWGSDQSFGNLSWFFLLSDVDILCAFFRCKIACRNDAGFDHQCQMLAMLGTLVLNLPRYTYEFT